MSRGLELGPLERYLVEGARVLSVAQRSVELITVARRHPWPEGLFPPPPEDAGSREGRLRLDVAGETAIRSGTRPTVGSVTGHPLVIGGLPPPAGAPDPGRGRSLPHRDRGDPGRGGARSDIDVVK